MNKVPIAVEPLEADPAHAHPSWCFSGTCTAPDRLLERGEREQDVPIWRRNNHYGRAHTIPTSRASEVELTVEVYRDVFQPVEELPDGVLLAFHAEYFGFSGTLLLTGEQMGPLATAFSSLRDLFEVDRNPLLDRVAESLRVLGCVTRGNAASLLSLGIVHVTDRERGQILEQFAPGGDE